MSEPLDHSQFLRRARHRTWNNKVKVVSARLTLDEWQTLLRIYETTGKRPATFATRAVREALKNATLGVAHR